MYDVYSLYISENELKKLQLWTRQQEYKRLSTNWNSTRK